MDPQTPAAAVPHTRRPPRFIGDASAVLLAALVGGVLGGVTWAMARPMQTVTFLEGGRLAVGQDGLDATFSALLWFTGIALVLGLVLGRLAETNLFISTSRYGMDWVSSRPIVAVLIVLSLLSIFFPLIQRVLRRRLAPATLEAKKVDVFAAEP